MKDLEIVRKTPQVTNVIITTMLSGFLITRKNCVLFEGPSPISYSGTVSAPAEVELDTTSSPTFCAVEVSHQLVRR